MIVIAYVPLFAAIVGILIYCLTENSKLLEIARAMFWTGIGVTLLTMAGQSVKIP